jgi:hypothetical protein
MQKDRDGLLRYINQNQLKINEMLPYIKKGSHVRSILDKTFPGIAPKLEYFGQELAKEQQAGTERQAATQTANTAAGYRILPLKTKE